MIEILLFVVILVLIGLHIWYIQKYQDIQSKLVKALLSKDVHEYTHAVMAEKKVKKEKAPQEDLVPFNELDDKDFQKAIKEQLNNG